MSNPTVAITRCPTYGREKIFSAIARQFELLGGVGEFISAGDSVLLKPNFIAPRSRRCATQTDPAVIIETARLLKDFGARPFVGDSPAWGDVFGCVGALKMEEDLKKLGVGVRQLDNPRRCRIGPKRTKVGISSVALEADKIINLPKFKSHQQLVATFAVKNMFGAVCGKQKAYWHFAKGKRPADFCELLIEIYKFLNPVLTIIDGVIAMDGAGPINGRAKPLGWLIAGSDPISCEVVCSKLINIDPHEMPIIKTAVRLGYGCAEAGKISIAGDDYSRKICADFQIPKIIAINFSLAHVCKSICKQILLLGKSIMKGFFTEHSREKKN